MFSENEQISNQVEQANKLRKLGDFERALHLYKGIESRDEYIVSGMSYCYRKLEQSNKAVLLLNNYIRENNIDLKKDSWFKKEVVWAYVQYYLNDKYPKKDIAIKAANKILELEGKNKIILRQIKNSLCTEDMIKKYPRELKELLEKINNNDNEVEIRLHLIMGENINTCIYYSLILSKIKILLELEEYNEIINIHSKLSTIIDDRHLDRGKAKALQGLGENEDAIDILEKTNIRFGKQYYIYTDIGDIYNSINDKNNSLKYYYNALDLCHEDKFLLTTLYKISNLLLDIDKELSRKHIDLEVLIRKNEGWKVKDNELQLIDKLNEYKENSDYNLLKKELKSLWKRKANEGKEVYEGIIDRVLDNGNGFIKYEENNRIFFKRDKKNKFNVGDKIIFYIEKSYDRKKGKYSEAATQLRHKK